jgi:hypothetical protein
MENSNLAAAICVVFGMPTTIFAYEIGSYYDCPSEVEQPVTIWIGAIDEDVVSVSIWPTGTINEPSVGHAPFAKAALGSCVPRVEFPIETDVAQFNEGYKIWSTAVEENNAGYWTLTPPDAYAAILGVLN